MNETAKAIISVSEMARMVGLPRSRFYQLQGTAFPHPFYDIDTRRPFYVEDQQAVCLEVRRRNCGIDGRPILFYAQRPTPSVRSHNRRKPKREPSKPTGRFAAVLDGVRTLGLASATDHQVGQAVRELFPTGTTDAEPGEIIRAVFVHLMRQNSTDNLRR